LQEKVAVYLANGSEVRKESREIRSELLPGMAIPLDSIL
jgi:hypothetical protein